ncbi:MAG TPA: amidohydrolase family protein [Desulfatiglandales bacterium]|nr:amidohydrolase family protein [Desulfatiglandales bacterium]
MSTQVTVNIISADSHVVEPPGLWIERADKRYRDQAPRVYWDDKREGWFFGGQGVLPSLVPGMFAAGKRKDELVEHYKAGYQAAPAGITDPAARTKEMERDHVEVEVLYTSLGFGLFWIDEADFQEDCFRVYNDWLAEYVSYDQKRFVGLGLISLWNVKNAVKELHRCRKIGLKGAMIWASPPDHVSFNSTGYDPFWATAQELEMPVSLHILTGRGGESREFFIQTLDRCIWRMMVSNEIQRSLAKIIFSGVLERFPNLQLVAAENDIGWTAYFLYLADLAFNRYGKSGPTKLSIRPSEYFQRQISATFIRDLVGLLTVRRLGSERFLWSNDYPHQSSTWPESLDAIATDFTDLSEDDTKNILHDNCAKLYGIQA